MKVLGRQWTRRLQISDKYIELWESAVVGSEQLVVGHPLL